MIPFNKPYMSGNELLFIKDAVESGKISGNGIFTKKVHDWFSKRYGFPKSLLTSSCTDALEMCAIAIDLKAGDEVIVPDYTFVSSANAFVMHGAKIVFADPNLTLELPSHVQQQREWTLLLTISKPIYQKASHPFVTVWP